MSSGTGVCHSSIHTRDGHTVVIDFFRPEDAPGISDLFKAVYGDQYPIRLYYDPEALIRSNTDGDCSSIVARSETGKVVGVTHVIRSSPYEGVYESATRKGPNAFLKLFEKTVKMYWLGENKLKSVILIHMMIIGEE